MVEYIKHTICRHSQRSLGLEARWPFARAGTSRALKAGKARPNLSHSFQGVKRLGFYFYWGVLGNNTPELPNLCQGVKIMAGKKGFEVLVDPKRCKKCGICYAFCPKQVLAGDKEGRAEVVNPDVCIGCRLCELRCPDFAIKVRGKEE